MKECPDCHGLKIITITDPDTGFEYTILCPACDGTGQIDDDGE